jgi:hypothetical protein
MQGAPSEFDRLSIKLIQIIAEEPQHQIDEFIDELIRFPANKQYEDGVLMTMSILFKKYKNQKLKERIL